MLKYVPKVIVHRFKKELVVGSVERRFEVTEGDSVRRYGQLDEVGGIFIINVINNLCLFGGGHDALDQSSRMLMFS